jgi:hypothetical protein
LVISLSNNWELFDPTEQPILAFLILGEPAVFIYR